MPSTKINQYVQLGWTAWPPELKIEISLNDISLATGQYIISCARIQVSDPGPKGPLVSQSTFLKNSFRNTISVSNSFDPDQDWLNVGEVGPDRGPNGLQKFPADETSKQRVKYFANLNLS